jgi:hypothetical protein
MLIECIEASDMLFEQAKEMEKQQIIEAYGNVCFDEDGNYLTAEKYYKENYKSE